MTDEIFGRESGNEENYEQMMVDNAKVNEHEMKTIPLYSFFLDELKNLFYIEHALKDALQNMHSAASTDLLKSAFKNHLSHTETHIVRLETVFNLLNEIPEQNKNDAIDALIREGNKAVTNMPAGSFTRDAVLIISAQKAEHLEISCYDGLKHLAVALGYDQAADLLEKTLQEEIDTDFNLKEIARTQIYFDAVQEEQ